MKIENLTQDQLDNLISENKAQKQALEEIGKDFVIVKDSIVQIVKMIGLLDEKGDLKESVDFTKMLRTVSDIAWMGEKKRAEQFGFLTNLLPIIVKYKDVK